MLGSGWLAQALLPRMRTLDMIFIVDHLGMFPAWGVGTAQFFNLLADWLPTDALRRKVLCENPERLFGFDAAAAG